VLGPDPRFEAVLESYRRFIRALQHERAQRGGDPWHHCPLTLPQLRALNFIANEPRGVSSRELAVHLGVGASAITPLVDRLVERGYVMRHEDPHDRRIARLLATDAGQTMLERWNAVQTDLMRDALKQLSSDELATVDAALHVLRVALERISATPHTSSPNPEGILA
jgi:DNA-binding MarR family transcriptional regulator